MDRKALIAIAFGLFVIPALAWWVEGRAPGAEPAANPAATPAWLQGLWMRADIETWDDQVRFHYFHDSSPIGLYRYGKRCLNNTHSYDVRVDGDRVTFVYRKTGRRAVARVTQAKSASGDPEIVIDPDPEEGRAVRYRKMRPPVDPAGPVAREGGFDRMWMNVTEYKTGGMGFDIYQFKPPGMDGRGIGWFHTGDFDDWSTEALTYTRRLAPHRLDESKGELEFSFTCRRERDRTRFKVKEGKRRRLQLDKDPRNFWAAQSYTDGGKAFFADTLGPDRWLGLSTP